jgi:hypothetical protein
VRRFEIFNALLKFGYLDNLPVAAFVLRTAGVGLSFISLSCGIVEILVD